MQTSSRVLSLCAVLAALLAGCGTAPVARPADPVADLSGADPLLADVLVQRVAANNAHDWAAWQALHATACVRTAPELDAPLHSSAAMRAAIERLTAAFPDYHVALVRVVGQGPWVAAELTASGTMTHALDTGGAFSIPATGRAFRQSWTAFVHFDDSGHIDIFEEHWDQSDLNGQLMGFADPKPW